MKYMIDFQTGIVKECDGTLDQAMEMADAMMTYTHQNILIFDENDVEVARRNWYDVAYDPEIEDENEIVQFGNKGYYSAWYVI